MKTKYASTRVEPKIKLELDMLAEERSQKVSQLLYQIICDYLRKYGRL